MMSLTMALYGLVLSWMLALAPGRDHSQLAYAVALSSASETEAAILTAVAFRESSLRNDVSGDGGHSVCAFQIYDGPKALLEDPIACVATGARMLRESRRIDPAHPLAFYARGPRFRSPEAIRLSNDRVALAKRLLSMYP